MLNSASAMLVRACVGCQTSAALPITVFINDDKYTEPDETFTVTLSNPVGAGFNAPTTITGTIVDNDTGAPLPSSINDTPFFVRQHYLDFLNRAPDQAGFNAFVTLLNNCLDLLKIVLGLNRNL